MTVPTLTVEIATSGGPLTDSPTWTTIAASDVLAFSMTEGRQSATDDATSPSTAVITLDNSSRTYDPTNIDSSLNGYLKPATQVRVTATVSAADTVLFRGVVGPEGWRQTAYAHPASSKAVLSCVDIRGHLASYDADLESFAGYLRSIAEESNLTETGGVLLWPLDDSTSTGFEGVQIFNDPVDPLSPFVSHPATFSLTGDVVTGVQPSRVHSATVLHRARSGSLDSADGGARLPLGTVSMGASSALYHGSTSHGFVVRLRSWPTKDRAPMLAPDSSSFGQGNGFYIDRDGTLSACWDEGTTDLVSPTKLELNRTYFICGTYNYATTTAALYVDGAQVAIDGNYPDLSGATSAIVMSVGRVEASGPIANYSDAWAIRTALTAAQIATMYVLFDGFAGAKTGDAAGALLDSLGVSNSCSGGRVAVVGSAAAASPAALLQQWETTEMGRLFYNHANQRFEFVTLQNLATATQQTVAQFALSDDVADSTAIRYSNPQLVNIRPANAVTAANGAASWTRRDGDSIDLYGVVGRSVQLVSEPELDGLGAAEWVLHRQGSPGLAVSNVTIRPSTEAQFAAVLGTALADRGTLTFTPHNMGDPIESDVMLEGRSFVVGDGVQDWTVSFYLRQADPDDFWTWGTGEFNSAPNGFPDRNGARLGP